MGDTLKDNYFFYIIFFTEMKLGFSSEDYDSNGATGILIDDDEFYGYDLSYRGTPHTYKRTGS